MPRADRFPPTLAPDEHEVLRGGFGGLAWIYTFIVAAGLAATIVLMPIALFFWLRSSRFVLTDRRLVVKPRIGHAREFAIEQLRGAKLSLGSATDTVSVDGPLKLRLRWQRGSEKVWGALLVMSQWPLPPVGPRLGAGCELAAHTVRRSSEIRQQAGLGVVCGEQFAFLPLNSGLRVGRLGRTAALAVVGVREVTTRPEFPVAALVDVLQARGGDVAAHVAALAEALGGLVWTLSRTQRQPSRRGVTIAVGDERLEMHADERSARLIAGR